MSTHMKTYVEFISPGTLVDESSCLEIASCCSKNAVEMSKQITERHGAKPYGFVFITRLVHDPVSDGEGGEMEVLAKEKERSGIHFLGGTLRTYDEVVADNLESERILRSNMLGNSYPIVIENRNSYRSTHEFTKDDCIVDATGEITRRGNDDDLTDYRNEFQIARNSNA